MGGHPRADGYPPLSSPPAKIASMSPAPNSDSLPTPKDPRGQCPRCGFVSNFKVELSGTWINAGLNEWGRNFPDETLGVLRCNGCENATVVVTDRHEKGVHWYPAPGMGVLDRQVDLRVASAYDEGMRCLSIGANRASAVMFRSALSHFVKDKGDDKAKGERHLKTALKHMKESGALHGSLWDWADHLNQLGNEAAHPEDYDDVTAPEAKSLGEFVRHLIRHEYEMPAQLRRARGLLDEDHEPEDESDGPGASAADSPLHVGMEGRLVNPSDPQSGV